MRARVPRNACGSPKTAVDGVLGAIDRKLRLAPLRLERKTPPRELLDRERALDRRLDVELLADVRLLTDQLTSSARQLLASRLRRLPEVDRSPALGHLVRDPRLEAQARNLLDLIDRLIPR